MNRDDVYTVVGRYSKVYLFLSLVLLEISGFGHYSNVDPYMKNDFWEGVENSRFGINRMILKDLKRTAIGHNEAGDSTDGVGEERMRCSPFKLLRLPDGIPPASEVSVVQGTLSKMTRFCI
ncbi:uncharacterized protein [Macrobrachium rosenbergii]|uniref:uncharacterized protein isoform X1 n=1 Tax=Macrobrachium rosenbergii TaxID=79674 RepID=UPI0034D6A33E